MISIHKPKLRSFTRLLRFCETDSAVAKVIHAVPLPQESISQDGQGADRLREVHAHKRANAGALDFEDVVIGANGEVVARQGESEVRQGVALLTLDCILTGERLLGTNFLVPARAVSA